LRRSANIAVNCSGMCWTTTIPATVTGRRVSTASSACVPPVEVPMAITLSVVFEHRPVPAARIASAVLRASLSRSGGFAGLTVLVPGSGRAR
jgi:hypothetical protein